MRRLLTLGGAVIVLAACLQPPLPPPTLPAGDVSTIRDVMIAKPDPSEMDHLTTISTLPAETCTQNKDGKVCSIDSGQEIKWGWGFCEDDEATLQSEVPDAQVELIVDGVKIPSSLIYQRDEVYERPRSGYCHTWSIKLSNWQAGSSVRLENRATAGSLRPQSNVFVMNVQ